MLELFLGGLLVLLIILCYFLYQRVIELSSYANDLSFSKQSQSVKYGKMSENWIPLSEKFPYDKERFRFLGNPIDGITFLDDKIVFCEFKSGKAKLSPTQEHVRKLVQNKQVEWLEFRVSND